MDSANCIAKQCAGNMFILAAFITAVSIAIHMLFGSVIAVMGIVIPAMLAFTGSMGISTIIPVMIAYIAINAHFILPFHNLAILVGVGEDNGMYTEKKRSNSVYRLRSCCSLLLSALLYPGGK